MSNQKSALSTASKASLARAPAIQKVLEQVAIVAPTDSTVLLHGETGTGKELIARAIHNLSSRRERPYVRMNCAAIPSGLLESELFGHEKGAFTGALMQRKGRFESADGGSLFLDEIGDISLELQPKLLRAIQEQEFERLGSSRTISVNVRLIAATHRDLPAMIRDEKFREDLFYRFNVFPIEIPPLRERREDIPLLVNYFVSKVAGRMRRQIKSIPKRAMELLTNCPWKGNIRELANFIERAVILTRGEELEVPVARACHLIRDHCCCGNGLYVSTSRVLCNHRRFESRIGTDRRQGGSRRASRIEAYDAAKQDSSPGDFEGELLPVAAFHVSDCTRL